MISGNTNENKLVPSLSAKESNEEKKYRTVLVQSQVMTFKIDLEQLFGEFIDLSKNQLYQLEFNDIIDNETASIDVFFVSKTED